MSNHVSNPFSTGGGGTTFEQLVGIYYLISLLAADIPRGLNNGICYQISFQQRWNDAILDDIVVIARSSNTSEHKLMLQVKHEIIISSAISNDLFRRVIGDCWETFEGLKGEFNPNTDRLGIAVGIYHSKVDEHLQRLLHWARTSASVEDFRRINIAQFASSEMRTYLSDFKIVLNRITGKEISEGRLWQFLKCLVYIHFDIENDGSRDLNHLRNRIADQLVNRDDNEVKNLINSLQVLVSEYAKTGGSIDVKILRQHLNHYGLKDQVDCTHDLERLRNHSGRTLSRIKDTIGQRIRLPRLNIVSETIEAIRHNPIVFILGEPGAGKSVLLKKMVDYFGQEGEVLVTSIDNLSGTTLEEFFSNLQIKHDFQILLSAFKAAPFRCLFIDQLEQALSNEQHKNVLYDLIYEIRKYNDAIPDSSKDTRWRIVATCRTDQFYSILPSLQTEIGSSTLEITVPPLETSDVEIIVETFTSFQHLSRQQHVQNLLYNPFILDFLTFPELKLVNLPKPEIITESWLAELYWMQIVRNSERNGRGNPDIREQAVILLREHQLRTGKKQIPVSALNPEIIGSLSQDRVIYREDGRIGFVHDILEDWTVSRMLLSHRGNLPILLREYNETLQLIRPINLLALRQLELKQDANQWLELLSILKNDDMLAARWYQTVLVAPLSSPMISSILPLIVPFLFIDDGILLHDFVRGLRTVYTVPNQSILELLKGTNTPQVEFEKMLAWSREPIADRWIPVWNLLFKHQDNLPVQALSEIAEAAYLWVKSEKMPLRIEIGLFCLAILKKDFQNKFRNNYYDDNYPASISRKDWLDTRVVRKFREAILHGADCIPQEVKTLLYSLVETEGQQLANLLFGKNSSLNWVPIAKHMPDIFTDVTLKIFCDISEIRVNEVDDIFSRSFFRESGIRHDNIWRFNANYKEHTPFYYFLNMNPTYGVKLIVELVNFMTRKWLEMERLYNKINPLSQILTLLKRKQEFWGNYNVYNWWVDSPSETVKLALTALRYWLDEYLKSRNDEDPRQVFDIVLSQSNSFAIVAICILIASEDIEKRVMALLPILEQPVFWELDTNRLTHMMMLGQKEKLYNFVYFAQYILLFAGTPEDQQRLQSALLQFPSNIPFLSEEEKDNIDLVANRKKYMEQIATYGNLENYSFKEHDNGLVIEFNFPEEIEQQRQLELKAIEPYQLQTSLQSWAHLVISRKHPTNLSVDRAIRLAKEIEASLETSEDIRFNIGIIAETCAASVLQYYEWLKENEYLEWCRQKLFDAILYENEQSKTPDPITGLSHIVVKALPLLVIKDQSDNEVRELIWYLIIVSNPPLTDGAIKSLFEGLAPFWQINPNYMWQCYNLLIAKAEVILANRNKVHVQKEETEMEELTEIKADMPKLSQLDIDFVYLLTPLIVAFPRFSDSHNGKTPIQFVEFIAELVTLNNKAYKHSQITKESREYKLFQVPQEWENALYELLTNWILNLPWQIACKYILDPIINLWEEGAEALENLLDKLLLNTQSSEYKERFIAIWKYTIPRIIQTPTVQTNPQGQWHTNPKDTYSCLILMPRYSGIIDPWEDRNWNPSSNLIQEFDLWVKKLGHYYDNFSILIKMLRTVGKPIRIPYAINWLFEIFQHSENLDHLFGASANLSALSLLLFDIWFEYEDVADNDQVLFQRFIFLVDYLASKGEQIAVELQRKLVNP